MWPSIAPMGLVGSPAVQIRVLGPVEVVGADGPVRGLERKPRELLALLALRAPATVRVDELAALLWDAPPPTAAKTLRSHLSRVRAALGATGTAALERSGGDAYALRAARSATDVDVVADHRARARRLRVAGQPDAAAVLLQGARSLWRGDVELPATVAALAIAGHWARERHELAVEHLAALVDGSHPADAVAELETSIAADPLDEALRALLVAALHRSGRRSAALRAYQAARVALADVGLEPGPGLRAAEAAVLADEPTTPTSASATGTSAVAHVPERPPWSASVEPSAVRYARAGTVNVAHVSVGAGPPDVLLLNPGLMSIDALTDEPHLETAIARLARTARVVCLDRRGIGLSDPAPSGPPGIADWVDDVVAVLDAVGATAPLVVANADTCLLALALAAAHPGRVAGLVLVHGYVRYLRAPDYPFGIDPVTATEQSAEVLAPDSPPGRFDPLAVIAPSVAGDPAFRRWWDAMGRRAASPATAGALHGVILGADVRAVVAHVAAPTLVVHRRSCAAYDVGHARHLAEHLADVRRVSLPGADELWFTGDVDALLDEVDAFRTEIGA
jgi:DNA-binding SARP family transcriptional activator/pimeloyl-ACP methyl ester carboxylesterase